MRGTRRLAKWLMPSTITLMELEIEKLKEENYRLKRIVAMLEEDARRKNMWWPFFDHDRAYGGGSGETEN